MNSIIISGRLGRNPELKATTSGKSVARFSIANDEGYGDSKKTSWINVVAWEKTAELAQKYLSKGSKVLIRGTLQIRAYESQDGEKKSATEITAREIEFLDPRKESDQPTTSKSAKVVKAPAHSPAKSDPFEVTDDDIPF